MSTQTDILDALRAALAEAGQPVARVEIDGEIHRYHPDGKHNGDVPCWYRAQWLGEHLTATFGDWRKGSGHKWRSWEQCNGAPVDFAAIGAEHAARKRQAEQDKVRRQAEAATKAREVWKALSETGTSAYLERKQVLPVGVRFGRDNKGSFIAIPLRDPNGELRGLQRIYEDGAKRFDKGVAKKRAFHLIGTLEPDKPLYVAEGYATAASIYLATGCAVAVAFDAGNLAPVLEGLRKRHPGQRLVIAADNDQWKPDKGNPGKTKALEAARQYNVSVALPDFSGLDDSGKPTDFNDLHRLAGLEIVKQQLEAAAGEELPSGEERNSEAAPPRKSQATELVEIAQSAELFHDAEDSAYATLRIGERQEHWPVRSRSFRDWLARRYWIEHRKTPSSQAMTDALNVIDGLARYDGEEHAVHIRVAGSGKRIYLDLCDPAWRCIDIGPDGWQVVDKPTVRFIRRKGMLALPAPVRDGALDGLWGFLNAAPEERVLVGAWLVQALRPRGPYPVLNLQGEQGTAKSTFTRVLRNLVDPSVAPLRTKPRDERDLLIAARNSHLVALDNLSGLPPWLSDALCRIATGGGFSTRELYTDSDEVLIDVQRPIILNGIDDIATRQDLIGRSIVLNLAPIPEDQRRDETEFWTAFDQQHPSLLGALLDAVVTALRELPTTTLDRKPRMADFALWATAAEPALGASQGQFMRVYSHNQVQGVEAGLEGSSTATALRNFMELHDTWESTATDLLKALETRIDDTTQRQKSWPKSPKGLSSQLRRLAPALRIIGLHIDFRHSGDRTIRIDWIGKNASNASMRPDCNKHKDLAGTQDGRIADAMDASGASRKQGGRIVKSHEASNGAASDATDATDARIRPLSDELSEAIPEGWL